MKKISILVAENSVIQLIADPKYCFETVNRFLNAKGNPSMFDVKLVGAVKEIKLDNGIYTVHTEKLLNEVERTDLIIIPALFGNLPVALESNQNLISWRNNTKWAPKLHHCVLVHFCWLLPDC